jgi:hypothetical protein
VTVRRSDDLTPDELQQWLEWAGSRLLSLNVSSPLPRKPKVLWPDYVPDPRAYGYSSERLRPPKLSGADISLMDEILVLPNVIKDITVRRVVNSRSLVTPISNKYVYSWVRIAFMLHCDRRKVMRLHRIGLEEIIKHIERDKISTIRQRLSLPPT